MLQFFSTGQLARMLGVQAYKIEYAHATRQLEEPGFRFVGKRAYSVDDVRRVAEHFGLNLDAGFNVSGAGKETQ